MKAALFMFSYLAEMVELVVFYDINKNIQKNLQNQKNYITFAENFYHYGKN